MHQGSSSRTGGHDDSCKLQLTAYAKADIELQDKPGGYNFPVMVSITAPSGTAAGKLHSPVDLVLVLNVHDTGKKRQKLLVDAVKMIAQKLDGEANSGLAIVGGQSTFLPMTAERGRVEMATDAVMAYYPISTYTYTSTARALALAEKLLYGRKYKDKSRRAGHIIIISDSRDDPSTLATLRFPCIHALGFRDGRNATTMDAIATNPGCTYAILDDEHSCLTQSLAATIDRITSSIAVEVKLKCECDQSVVISSIDAPRITYFISYDNKVGTIFASAHLGGGGGGSSPVATNIIVYLNTSGRNNPDFSKLFTLHMEYGGGYKMDGEVVTVRTGMHGSKQLAAEMVRIDAVKIVDSVIAIALDKDHFVAADKLHQWWAALEKSEEASGALSQLNEEMLEMETRMYNNYLWLEYMMSWQSHHKWQLPLPPLFMEEKQQAAAGRHPLRLEILAAIREPAKKGALPLPFEVLVRVVVPKFGLAKVKRAPVDLIAVLDARGGSLDSTRIKHLLVKATDLVMKKLNQNDRLAIIPVLSAEPVAPARLIPMSDVGQEETFTLLRTLLDDDNNNNNNIGKTPNWREQLNKVTKLDRRSSDNEHVSLVIPEPPQPKSQYTILSRALQAAIKILKDREGNENRRPGFVIVVSGSEDDSICQETLVCRGWGSTKRPDGTLVNIIRPDETLVNTRAMQQYIVHAFGFRSSGLGNTRAMQYIASTSNDGIYGVLNDKNDDMAEEFSACIDNITSVIAIDTRVEIYIDRGSSSRFSEPLLRPQLSNIKSGLFLSSISKDGTQGFILAGNICAGTARSFVVYTGNTSKAIDYSTWSKWIKVRVNWLNAWTSVRVKEVEGGRLVIICREELNEMIRQLRLDDDSGNPRDVGGDC